MALSLDSGRVPCPGPSRCPSTPAPAPGVPEVLPPGREPCSEAPGEARALLILEAPVRLPPTGLRHRRLPPRRTAPGLGVPEVLPPGREPRSEAPGEARILLILEVPVQVPPAGLRRRRVPPRWMAPASGVLEVLPPDREPLPEAPGGAQTLLILEVPVQVPPAGLRHRRVPPRWMAPGPGGGGAAAPRAGPGGACALLHRHPADPARRPEQERRSPKGASGSLRYLPSWEPAAKGIGAADARVSPPRSAFVECGRRSPPR